MNKPNAAPSVNNSSCEEQSQIVSRPQENPSKSKSKLPPLRQFYRRIAGHTIADSPFSQFGTFATPDVVKIAKEWWSMSIDVTRDSNGIEYPEFVETVSSPQDFTKKFSPSRSYNTSARLKCTHARILEPYLSTDAISVVTSFLAPTERFEKGQLVDCQDSFSQWYVAMVNEIRTFVEDQVETQKIYVHFIGWPRKWDEWISADSKRIEPYGWRTQGVFVGASSYTGCDVLVGSYVTEIKLGAPQGNRRQDATVVRGRVVFLSDKSVVVVNGATTHILHAKRLRSGNQLENLWVLPDIVDRECRDCGTYIKRELFYCAMCGCTPPSEHIHSNICGSRDH